MALLVSSGTTWATNFFGGITFSAADELSIANNVQNIVSGYYRWHWLLTTGVGVATVSGTQGYSFNAADQNRVAAFASANLLSGTTELPELLIWSDHMVPLTSTTGQPIAVSLSGATTYRLWPTPGAVYTFQHRYYARPVVFAANTESYQCPENFAVVLRAGVIWQTALLQDDERAPELEKLFRQQLDALAATERRTMERNR